MKDEALRLALEALKTCRIDGDGWSGPHYDFDDEKVGKAIIAIRQALEQPEPEPVAWIDHRIHGFPDCFVMQPEPPHTSPVYTSPPKREWQGLTDDEIRQICDENFIMLGDYAVDFIESIQAKLKEKNT